MGLVVYIDVYFLVNMAFNFCILLLVRRMQKRKRKVFRLLAGAAAGGLGAAIILFFSALPLAFQAVLQYGLLPGLMLIISFGFSDRRNFFHQLLTFYSIAFFLGGLFLAFRQEGKGMLPLFALLAVFSFLLWLFFPAAWRRQKEFQREYEVAVSFGEGWIKGKALFDTGNRLREPVSGKPVMLADFSAIKAGLPERLKRAVEAWSQEKAELENTEDYQKVRWIPYHAVGTKCGLLPGVEAEQVKIWMGTESITKEGVVLGIVFEALAAQGGYQFILHEDIMC